MIRKKVEYTKNYNYSDDSGEINITIDGFHLGYHLTVKDNYSAYVHSAATEREYLENIENDERTTHYMQLNDSDWKTIIHGLVDFNIYKVYKSDEKEFSLIMNFSFSGKGTSSQRMKQGESKVDLGKFYENGNELKLITDDGFQHIFTK